MGSSASQGIQPILLEEYVKHEVIQNKNKTKPDTILYIR